MGTGLTLQAQARPGTWAVGKLKASGQGRRGGQGGSLAACGGSRRGLRPGASLQSGWVGDGAAAATAEPGFRPAPHTG